MSFDVRFYVELCTLLFASVAAILRYKYLDWGGRYLCFWVLASLVTEIVAFYTAHVYKTNSLAYSVFGFVEVVLLCLFFRSVIDVFRRRKALIFVAIAMVILGLLNMLYLQPPKELNTNFIILEGFLIIGFCLFGLFRLLLYDGELDLFRNSNFWSISIVLVYWAADFLNIGLYNMLDRELSEKIGFVRDTIWALTLIVYSALAILFLNYRKLNKGSE